MKAESKKSVKITLFVLSTVAIIIGLFLTVQYSRVHYERGVSINKREISYMGNELPVVGE